MTKDPAGENGAFGKDKGDIIMKMHIEYDDFGEYIEVLEDPDRQGCRTAGSADGIPALTILKKAGHHLMVIAVAAAVMLCTTSYPGYYLLR